MGFLSKVFKPFKKIIRKVGGAIKSVAKIIAKPFKMIMKPIGKLFGKLGPIGSIALGFLLPGMGTVISSWFKGAGHLFQGVFKGMPKIFNAISKVGKAIETAATWGGEIYGKTVGKVFESVTGAIKGGIDALTGGKATQFGNWLGEFTSNIGDKLTYKGEGILDPISIADPTAIADASAAATKSIGERFKDFTGRVGDQWEESFKATLPADVEMPTSVLEPIEVTAKYKKPYDMTDEAFEKYKKTDAWKEHIAAGREQIRLDNRGAFEKGVDAVGALRDKITQSPAFRGYDMYNKASSYFADDPRMRMPGTQGASAFSMLGNMPGNFGSADNFITMDTSQFNNAPNFLDLLTKYASGFDATMSSQFNPTDAFNFADGLGGYGFNVRKAIIGGDE